MKLKTKILLRDARQFCIDNDKSSEFTLQYMQDVANVDLDCVINYIEHENQMKRDIEKASKE